MDIFSSAEALPLSQFGLLWRWNDPRHAVLPDGAIAQIHALSARAAAELARTAATLGATFPEGQWPTRIPAPSDSQAATDRVRAALQALPIAAAETIVVSWSVELAVFARWGIFAEYWDTFCYPSSDDVTVWPTRLSAGGPEAQREAWVLQYRHYELIEFGYLDPVRPN